MRSVLILAHSWPPDANVGAVRPVYLARQLATSDWQPLVVTVRERYYDHKNSAGIAGSELAQVTRTHCLPNPRNGYLWLKKLLTWPRRLFASNVPARKTESTPSVNQQRPDTEPGLLKRTFLSLLYTPDEFLGWFPFALFASIRLIHRHRPACIISTGPPYTSHLVAMVLKLFYGTRWIADYRDPWSWREGLASEIRSPTSDRINAFLEKIVMRNADCIVCVTPRTTDRYRALYPDLPGSKWFTITNGYDLDDFSALMPVEKHERFTISYVGSFDFSRTPRLLLQAVGDLISEGKLDRKNVMLRFVGPCQSAEGRSVAEMINENGLDGIADLVGFLPRTEAMKEILRADVLLLLGGTQRLSIAAKVYEYIASGNPILAISEEGDTADLIRRIDGGRVVAPDNINAAKDAITAWYDDFLRRPRTAVMDQARNTGAREDYSWDRLGARYIELLEAREVAGIAN